MSPRNHWGLARRRRAFRRAQVRASKRCAECRRRLDSEFRYRRDGEPICRRCAGSEHPRT